MILNFIILIVISVFWALGFLFVKVGERSITPITEMTARAFIAGLALLVICLLLKKDLSKSLSKFRAFIVFSILGITIPWLGIAYSEEIISSGLAAAMLSTLPIFTFIIAAFIIKTERFTIYSFAGLLIALIGLVLVIGIEKIFGHSSTLMGVLIILGAFFSYAVNGIIVPIYAKDVDPFITITYTICFGAIIIAVLAFTFEKPTMADLNVEDVWSLIGLGVISTAVAFSGYYVLLKRAGPFFTSLVGYLAPVFGVIAGVIFLHEHIDLLQIVGIFLVLLGVFLVNKPKFYN
ncbi:DMT family transporter [Desulfobacterota bacterium AH_259_B03_O07]|nr:DMT family transporter [Desulfobacterota bacterium AH_259_B03_O07]